MCSTYCQQESSANFHIAGQERAATELAALYEAVKNMPDGPQKTHFLKKVCETRFSGFHARHTHMHTHTHTHAHAHAHANRLVTYSAIV